MKVERAISAPPVSLHLPAARPVDYSTESTLVSPHAPSFPRLAKLFSWLWSILRSLFSFCLPKEEPPAPVAPPSPEILQMVAKVWKKEPTPPLPPPAPIVPPPILQPAVTAVGLYYLRGAIQKTGYHEQPGFIGGVAAFVTANFPLIIANNCANVAASTFERIASKTAPTISNLKVKTVSRILANGAVWYAANQLGCPLGYLFLINTAFQVFQNSVK